MFKRFLKYVVISINVGIVTLYAIKNMCFSQIKYGNMDVVVHFSQDYKSNFYVD